MWCAFCSVLFFLVLLVMIVTVVGGGWYYEKGAATSLPLSGRLLPLSSSNTTQTQTQTTIWAINIRNNNNNSNKIIQLEAAETVIVHRMGTYVRRVLIDWYIYFIYPLFCVYILCLFLTYIVSYRALLYFFYDTTFVACPSHPLVVMVERVVVVVMLIRPTIVWFGNGFPKENWLPDVVDMMPLPLLQAT